MTDNEQTCGTCRYWARDKKRNCSHPETPVYFAECLYPVEILRLPICATFEETNEKSMGCPCFVLYWPNLVIE